MTVTSDRHDMAASGNAASSLLDFKQPFNVDLLDTTIKAFYGAGSNQEVRTPSEKDASRHEPAFRAQSTSTVQMLRHILDGMSVLPSLPMTTFLKH